MTTPRPRHAADEIDVAHPSVGTLVKEATEQVSTLVRGEIELAKTEVKGEIKKGVTGSGLLIGAVGVLLAGLPFLFVTLAEVLIGPVGLDRWLGYLIIFVLFIIVGAVLALLGLKKVKKVRAPKRTIESMKKNQALVEAVKTHDQPAGAAANPNRANLPQSNRPQPPAPPQPAPGSDQGRALPVSRHS
ncbi:phage holin family protein [Epidermidibacterium keratini]|uniref:Phage holin family protein n=1 Tax=Epidermidibacterium keratini TaxID=1891644 RepID=A0A7L4YM32_9ACTN|nr:phage holin family protein [Epidermidibacterium keratini]QHC00112.1 phage holin family protein [Epidermidibacterium keratini]